MSKGHYTQNYISCITTAQGHESIRIQYKDVMLIYIRCLLVYQFYVMIMQLIILCVMALRAIVRACWRENDTIALVACSSNAKIVLNRDTIKDH